MRNTKKFSHEEIRALAMELHEVGCKTANRQKPFGQMCRWNELAPYVQAGHDAMAAYVLRKFTRIQK